MNIIKTRLTNECLLPKLEDLYSTYKSILFDLKRIGYINLYHKHSELTIDYSFIKNISLEINECISEILTIGIICAPPDCPEQPFHIDYDGKTSTYFIPLTDIDDDNGTEYADISRLTNADIFELHNRIIYDRNELKLKTFIVNAPKYSLIKMDTMLLHRGQSNKKSKHRCMFQIVVCKIPDFIITSDVLIPDAELDENNDRTMKLLNSRTITK